MPAFFYVPQLFAARSCIAWRNLADAAGALFQVVTMIELLRMPRLRIKRLPEYAPAERAEIPAWGTTAIRLYAVPGTQFTIRRAKLRG